jgi:general secretion pathway protein F
MTWRYRAADASGSWHDGQVDAATEREAMDLLRARGLWVRDLTPQSGTPLAADSLASWQRWKFWQGSASLATPLRTLATLIEAGTSVDRALQFVAQSTTNDDPLSAEWSRVAQAVVAGQSLSEALAQRTRLPMHLSASVAAAEASGHLARVLQQVAVAEERREALQQRLRTALVYPAVLGLASVVATTVILVVVVPQFAALVADAGGELPLSTRLLLGASTVFVRGGWLLLVAGAALLWWWFARARSIEQAETHAARWLHLPVLGSYLRTRDAARYLDTLAVGLRSGVPLVQAMPLARATVRNAALVAQFAAAEPVVRDGGRVAEALRNTLPPLALRLLEAGEASGALAELSERAASAAQQETEQQVTRLVALVEPVLILGFGGLVGLVALALLQAIYSVNAGLT